MLKIKADIDLDTVIGEIAGTTDFISSAGKQTLIKAAKEQMEKDIMSMYFIARDQYNADVFGFGRRIEMKMPAVWNQIKEHWDEFFAELELDVNINIEINGSATTRTPLKVGE
ncbi:MAG: Ger(x)C family spore germination protein [Clostridia bacterium]|nr:Ger(x)C family spore germination protein [Clostridia bacterium]